MAGSSCWVTLCEQGRAAVIQPRKNPLASFRFVFLQVQAQIQAASCIEAVGRLPAELQGRIFRLVGKLDLNTAEELHANSQ